MKSATHILPNRGWPLFLAAVAALLAASTGRPAPGGPAAPARHWAFAPVRANPPPAVNGAAWVRTPVDRFILATLERHQLAPAPAADRATLARRAAFDLTGLPPTPEEVDAFVRDPAPTGEAFARVVERLLASPHYGERWARHWLDVARYADNKGYVFFEERTHPWAWTYRDYVVRAFNEDRPYDRFLREQLAADLQEVRPDPATLAALGFLTVGDHFSNNTHDILDDRIDVVTRGLLGLTVGCARCHDHKFDPVSMADYYGLYGVFASSAEPMVPPVAGAVAADESYEGFELVLLEKQRRLREFVTGRHREIVTGGRTRVAEYLLAAHAQRHQPPTESFMLIADRGDLHPAVMARWRLVLERAGTNDPVWAPWQAHAGLAPADFAAGAAAAAAELNRQAGLNPRVRAAFGARPAASMEEVAARYAGLLTNAAARPAADLDPAERELREFLLGPAAPPEVPAQMDWGFLSLLPDRASQAEFQKLLTDLEQWLMHGPSAPPRAMVVQDLPVAVTPRIFLRGNPARPGSPVSRRFLSILDPAERPFTSGSGRRELAEAIADPRNPLTARVMVNRVWLHHFGAGLVDTPGDFGRRGNPPSHPELLDWLADRFVQSGWSLKDLHRLVMNSAVYQQSSALPGASADGPVRDPENRWLWRMNPRRHDFETLRDAVLAVSGRLEPAPGGPPVAITAPRRTLYVFVDRLDLPPTFATFDFPSPSVSCPQRAQTTVAPQALFLMNHEFLATAAAATLGRPDLRSLPTVEARVGRLHEILLGRPAGPADLHRASRFLGAKPDEGAWQRYVHALMLTNEFAFVD